MRIRLGAAWLAEQAVAQSHMAVAGFRRDSYYIASGLAIEHYATALNVLTREKRRAVGLSGSLITCLYPHLNVDSLFAVKCDNSQPFRTLHENTFGARMRAVGNKPGH